MHSPLAYSMEVSSPNHFHPNILRLSDGPTAKGLCMIRNFKNKGQTDISSINQTPKGELENYEHRPVMVEETLQILQKTFSADNFGVYVDGTLGLAGHAKAILSNFKNFKLVGLDRDKTSLEIAKRTLKELNLSDRTFLFKDTYDNYDKYLKLIGEEKADFILLDLGFSSYQIEDPKRGFSYRKDSDLDMRMDLDLKVSAKDVVNNLTTKELSYILKTFGDERFHFQIAKNIVKNRPVNTTFELNEIIRQSIPAATRRSGGHPAQRTFQAIRIFVNSEFEHLYNAILKSFDFLKPKGVLIVLTYHSGEDRLVKNLFDLAIKGRCQCPPTIACMCGAQKEFAYVVQRKGCRPKPGELKENPRSKSAHLRAISKIRDDGLADFISKQHPFHGYKVSLVPPNTKLRN